MSTDGPGLKSPKGGVGGVLLLLINIALISINEFLFSHKVDGSVLTFKIFVMCRSSNFKSS